MTPKINGQSDQPTLCMGEHNVGLLDTPLYTNHVLNALED